MAELAAVAQVLLSLILMGAGIAKLLDRDASVAALRSYAKLPERWVGALAWTVPILECSIAVAVWIEPIRRVAAAAAAGLLIVFTALIVRLVRDGGQVGCGCFGGGSQRVTWFSVLRNLVLIAAAGVALVANSVEVAAPVVLTGAGVAILIMVVDVAASSLALTRPH